MVLELRPAVDWNKGAAVRWLAMRLSPGDEVPTIIYLGDDSTDEDVFTAWPEEITVNIGGGGATSANYRLRNPEEVRLFLEWVSRAR